MSYSQESKRAFRAARGKKLPFNTKAYRKWGKEAEWIHGEGPYASLAYCPSGGSRGASCLTIQLYSTLEDVVTVQFNLHCGGGCRDRQNPNRTDYHQIWDLSNRGYKRIDKVALEGQFIPVEEYQKAQAEVEERKQRETEMEQGIREARENNANWREYFKIQDSNKLIATLKSNGGGK